MKNYTYDEQNSLNSLIINPRVAAWPHCSSFDIFWYPDQFIDFLLAEKGYHICSHEGSNNRFFQLKKSFPTLYRTKMNRMTIFYLEGHEDDAARVFLENVGKKIISYQELKGITDVFHANLSKQEKQAFLGRNRPKRFPKPTDYKSDSLRENEDSLAYFYIRKYC